MASAKDAFGWSTSSFSTHASMMVAAAFDTGMRFVAISLRLPKLLAAGALWYGHVSARGFKLYEFVLNSCDCVDILVVLGWFKIYVE